ncbi:unnamed protein product [Owenia fusiformis]|uniref:Uncharacterized protein n=1 Tax=Owenia fusiformis TaxID=6347 RepID=A0A8J1U0G1_OWEFU|nr:unnamed protein product [Owenia fusiformis]
MITNQYNMSALYIYMYYCVNKASTVVEFTDKQYDYQRINIHLNCFKFLLKSNQLPGPLLYTGPDGLRDQRLAVNTPGNSVGVCNSNEHTSELGYLSRAPTDMKFPKAKNGNIGEIGWEVEYFKVKKGI